MPLKSGRHTIEGPARLAEGWTLERVTPASRLYGANGMRTGKDGRVYVAQCAGSAVSAINVDTGEIEAISPMGAGITGPDDLVFDDEGNLYVTEITEARVVKRAPNGTVSVVQGDMPVANPITFHQGHLIAGECRPGARIMELDRNGGAPRVLIEDVPMVNAFEVGPDGKLYFPVMGANQIWRISLEGGAPEIVASDLGVPNSVKFDPQGYIVSTQVMSGQVLRIDPQSGSRTVLADIGPGLDNCTFVGNRLFVSSISGQINEILEPGKLRSLIPDGMQWPLGLAVAEDGTLFIADGGFTYTIKPGGKLQNAGMLFTQGFPGYTRGVVSAGPGEWVVSTANGQVSRFWPEKLESQEIATGLDQVYGIAIAPGGAVVFADFGTGRVQAAEGGKVTDLAAGLKEPKGVAIGSDGTVYISETGAGRVVKLAGGRTETVLDGLKRPEGIFARGNLLYILDAGARELYEYDLTGGSRRTIAANLPVGVPPGVNPKPLRPFLPLAGSMGPFVGIAGGPDGTIYVSGDAEGSVLAVRPTRH